MYLHRLQKKLAQEQEELKKEQKADRKAARAKERAKSNLDKEGEPEGDEKEEQKIQDNASKPPLGPPPALRKDVTQGHQRILPKIAVVAALHACTHNHVVSCHAVYIQVM